MLPRSFAPPPPAPVPEIQSASPSSPAGTRKQTKSVRERTRVLRDEVYGAMTRLSENSDVEVIKYIKKDADASEGSE